MDITLLNLDTLNGNLNARLCNKKTAKRRIRLIKIKRGVGCCGNENIINKLWIVVNYQNLLYIAFFSVHSTMLGLFLFVQCGLGIK